MTKMEVSANRPLEDYKKKVDPDTMTCKREQTWQPSSWDHSMEEKTHTSDSSDCYFHFLFFFLMCSLWGPGMILIIVICLRLGHINYCHTTNQQKTW